MRRVGGLALILAGLAVWPGLMAQAPQPPPDPPLGPDSQVQPGTPAGDVIKGEFTGSTVYPGTRREYWATFIWPKGRPGAAATA